MTEPRKPATPATSAVHDQALDRLNFSDRRDYDDVRRGFIAPLPGDGVVRAADGRIVWHYPEMAVAAVGDTTPPTVHPSLWRQAELLGVAGLFEVVADGIYQVRGADITNLTVVETPDGIVVIDPLTATETVEYSLALYRAHRGERPVVAVIYTHSHIDHYAGVRGAVDEADVRAGTVRIVAPDGFMKNTLDEMIMGGTAMSRRSSYQYGEIVGPGPDGIVTSGLGLGVPNGSVTLIAPTDTITDTDARLTLGGLSFQFHLAPDSEAPSEMFVYIPDLKALCPAECACHTQHNLYTLRGAKIRDARAWSTYLRDAARLYADAEVYFAPHQWPAWGREDVRERLLLQSAMYKYLHDQTLRLANQGYTMTEAAEQITLPDSIATRWDARGYYGTTNHNVKSIWNFYLGWYDGNPSHLHPLPPADAASRYVTYMGGADAVIARARAEFDQGDYRWLAEVLSHVVFADPGNIEAKNLLADVLEQLGYQSEAGTWRGWYLTGAHELRHGVKRQPITNSVSIDTVRAMPAGMFFDFLGIHVNGPMAAGIDVTVNFSFHDTGERYALSLRHSVLDYEPDTADPHAALSLAMPRAALDAVIEQGLPLSALADQEGVRATGDRGALERIADVMDVFDLWWPIVTP